MTPRLHNYTFIDRELKLSGPLDVGVLAQDLFAYGQSRPRISFDTFSEFAGGVLISLLQCFCL